LMSFLVRARMDFKGESSSCAKPEMTVKESEGGGLNFIFKTRLTRVELVTLSSVD
jgi:hypothetical protein